MSKRKPPHDATVISLQDVRKRIEDKAKQTGGTPADIFYEMFGHSFGFPGTPYDEAVRRQQAEAESKNTQEKIAQLIKEKIVETNNTWKEAYDSLHKSFEKAIFAAEVWRAAALKTTDHARHYRDEYDKLKDVIEKLTEAIELNCGYSTDAIREVLRSDPRMPKLSIMEWELLFADFTRNDRANIDSLFEAAEDASADVSGSEEQSARISMRCDDCGEDTDKINEYYMVKDEIWEKAGASEWPEWVKELKEDPDLLCIGCLEKRIGRQLTKQDFAECPVNELAGPFPNKSERLRNRLTAEVAP